MQMFSFLVFKLVKWIGTCSATHRISCIEWPHHMGLLGSLDLGAPVTQFGVA